LFGSNNLEIVAGKIWRGGLCFAASPSRGLKSVYPIMAHNRVCRGQIKSQEWLHRSRRDGRSVVIKTVRAALIVIKKGKKSLPKYPKTSIGRGTSTRVTSSGPTQKTQRWTTIKGPLCRTRTTMGSLHFSLVKKIMRGNNLQIAIIPRTRYLNY
jgi:hypothetical protein